MTVIEERTEQPIGGHMEQHEEIEPESLVNSPEVVIPRYRKDSIKRPLE